jgi:hypothetical protein
VSAASVEAVHLICIGSVVTASADRVRFVWASLSVSVWLVAAAPSHRTYSAAASLSMLRRSRGRGSRDQLMRFSIENFQFFVENIQLLIKNPHLLIEDFHLLD